MAETGFAQGGSRAVGTGGFTTKKFKTLQRSFKQ